MLNIYGRRAKLQVYPKVVQIAAEYPDIAGAMPHLAAVALEHKCPRIDLVGYYMDLRPEQEVECQQCHEVVPTHEFAATKCLDCVQADYQETAQ